MSDFCSKCGAQTDGINHVCASLPWNPTTGYVPNLEGVTFEGLKIEFLRVSTIARKQSEDIAMVIEDRDRLRAELQVYKDCVDKAFADMKSTDPQFKNFNMEVSRIAADRTALISELRPFGSGVNPINWGKIKAHLPTDLAKFLTSFNVSADECIAACCPEK